MTEHAMILQTYNLTRTYQVGRQKVQALNAVDIAIQKGEFVAIMGPSGCGKSTLLNLIGGLDQPTDGKVLLEGKNLADFPEKALAVLRREKIGFIFQRFDLFPTLTARENVEFPLLLAGKSHEERNSRSDQLLDLVGLTSKGDALPEELSGGQQQRVGIARALANTNGILLADEPTGNLDSATADEIMDALMTLARGRNLTLIMVTHDPEVAAHADRIIRLLDGHVIKDEGEL